MSNFTNAWRQNILTATGNEINQNDSALARFFEKVEIAANGCWIWKAGRLPSGYGRLSYRGSSSYAHRVIFEWIYGDIEQGMCICHHCDCPSCVNPSHLFKGTPLDNMKDRDMKGRNGLVKQHLSVELELRVCEVARRRMYSHTTVARLCRTSPSTVLKIAKKHGLTFSKGGSRKLTPYQEKELIERVQQGEALRRLALSYGISKAGVAGILKRHNVVLDQSRYHRPKVNREQEQEICFLVKGGVKQNAVAKMYNMSPSGVRDVIRRNKQE